VTSHPSYPLYPTLVGHAIIGYSRMFTITRLLLFSIVGLGLWLGLDLGRLQERYLNLSDT